MLSRFSRRLPFALATDLARIRKPCPIAASCRSVSTNTLTNKQFWRREAKVLAGLAVVTFVGSVAWQYQVQTIPEEIKRMVKDAAKLRLQGKLQQSADKYEAILKKLKGSISGDPFHIFEALFSLGDVYMELKETAKAEHYFRQADKACRDMIAEFHDRRMKRQQVRLKHAITLDRLAQLKHNAGKLRSAIELYREAAKEASDFESTMKPEDSEVEVATARLELSGILNNLTRALIASGEYDEAEGYAKRVVKLCRGAGKVKMGTRKQAAKAEEEHNKREAEKQSGSGEEGAKECSKKKKQKKKRRKWRKPEADDRKSVAQVAWSLLGDVRAARRAAKERREAAEAESEAEVPEAGQGGQA